MSENDKVSGIFNTLTRGNESKALQAGYSTTVTFRLRIALRDQLILMTCPLKPDEKILDVGCNNGVASSSLLGENRKIFGIDLSRTAIDEANKLGIMAQVAPSYEIPHDDCTFDKVIMTEVMQYLNPTQREKTLKELIRVLKPDGQLIIIAPNLDCWIRRIYRPKDHFHEHYRLRDCWESIEKSVQVVNLCFSTFPVGKKFAFSKEEGFYYQLCRWLYPIFGVTLKKLTN